MRHINKIQLYSKIQHKVIMKIPKRNKMVITRAKLLTQIIILGSRLRPKVKPTKMKRRSQIRLRVNSKLKTNGKRLTGSLQIIQKSFSICFLSIIASELMVNLLSLILITAFPAAHKSKKDKIWSKHQFRRKITRKKERISQKSKN